MSLPVFGCDVLTDLPIIGETLQGQLDAGNPYPRCRITGKIFDALVQRATTDTSAEFHHSAQFDEAPFTAADDGEQAVVDMLTSVANHGHEALLHEPHTTEPRLIRTGNAGRHPDLGFSNIVNLTLAGKRTTSVVDPSSKMGIDEDLMAGTISVIPSHLDGYYLRSLDHYVTNATLGGLMLQCKTQFDLRGARAGLMA